MTAGRDKQLAVLEIVREGFAAGKADAEIAVILTERGHPRTTRTVKNLRQAWGLMRGNSGRPKLRRPRESFDRKPANRFLKQDRAFCAAMRAAPECPPQYRNSEG